MIYFTLPGFYFNTKIINTVIHLDKKYYKTPVYFEAATGNFSHCYFNGGYNNNLGEKGALYDDFVQYTQQLNIPVCFNLSNIFIKEQDFFDTQVNLILSLNETGSNKIEFSNLPLYFYLKEKYPNYDYIYSKQAFSICENLSPTLIDDLILDNKIDFISLDEKHSLDLSFLKKIKNKNKIQITATSECNVACSQFNNCRIHQHQTQYDFSNFNKYHNCPYYIPYHFREPLLSLEKIEKDYVPLGFTHFSLGEVIHDEKFDNFILFFIEYFIKEEYQYEVLKKIRMEIY